jgi:hypothetical protein
VSRRPKLLAALLALGVLVFLIVALRRPAPAPSASSVSPRPADSAAPGPPPPAASAPPPAAPVPTLADFPLNAPGTDIHADLRLVSDTLQTFRSNFPRDGNPTGSNAEIVAALSGQNRLRLVLIPPGHPAVNRDGELCDRWGTPFFFHAESATRMEIRSAGPDRRLWTDDDLAYTP